MIGAVLWLLERCTQMCGDCNGSQILQPHPPHQSAQSWSTSSQMVPALRLAPPEGCDPTSIKVAGKLYAEEAKHTVDFANTEMKMRYDGTQSSPIQKGRHGVHQVTPRVQPSLRNHLASGPSSVGTRRWEFPLYLQEMSSEWPRG